VGISLPLIYRRDGNILVRSISNGQQAFKTIFEENRWRSSESRRSGCGAPHFGVLEDIMTTDQKIIGAKVGLIELAKQLGNVSQACKMMGYSRDSFYRFKEPMARAYRVG
jgi:hypothetical protein